MGRTKEVKEDHHHHLQQQQRRQNKTQTEHKNRTGVSSRKSTTSEAGDAAKVLSGILDQSSSVSLAAVVVVGVVIPVSAYTIAVVLLPRRLCVFLDFLQYLS